MSDSSPTPMAPGDAPAGYCRKCAYPMSPGRCPECATENVRVSPRPLRDRMRRRHLRQAGIACALIGILSLSWFYREQLAVALWPTAHLIEIERAGGRWGPLARSLLEKKTAAALAAARAEMAQRRERITAALTKPDLPEWAGQYVGGCFVEGAELLISPQAGFVLSRHSSMQKGGILQHGTVEPVGEDVLRFTCCIDPLLLERRRWKTWLLPLPVIPREMRIVRTPVATFLVPTDALRQFCIDATAGKDLSQRYFCRPQNASWVSPLVVDEPTRIAVPAEHRRYLLDRPIIGRIIEVDRVRRVSSPTEIRARVVLGVGSEEGVLEDMEFFVPEYSVGAQGRVLAVGRHRCLLEFRDLGSMAPHNPQRPVEPAAGWRMTTRWRPPPEFTPPLLPFAVFPRDLRD